MGKPDGIKHFNYTIIEHFVGTPSNSTSRIHNQLSNLHCPTLISDGTKMFSHAS